MSRHSTGAAAIALLAFVLAGCDAGGGTTGEVIEPDDVDAAEPAADDAGSPESAEPSEPGGPGDLPAALLTEADFPLTGWAARPDDTEPYVDDQTGGICTLELTDALPGDADDTHADRSFTNDVVVGMVHHGVYAVPDAEAVVVDLAAQLDACAGAYPGADGDTVVSVVSSPLSSVVPGAAVSVCRYHETTFVDEQMTFYGPWCIGATGDRLVEVVGAAPDPSAGIGPEEFEVVLTAVTAKALAD